MKTETGNVVMLNVSDLIISEYNYRQEGMRKLNFSEGWKVGKFAIVAIHPTQEGKYIVLDANRRVTLLQALKTIKQIPCVIVSDDVSTPAAITAAIEAHKGNELALGLVQLLDFGIDKFKYNVGKYTSKGGETAFLKDMLNFYEDFHPCPSGTADDKEIVQYHKGINQNVYRAISLGGEALKQYRAFAGKETKAKGISQALRKAYENMQAKLSQGESLDTAREYGNGIYNDAMVNYVPSGTETKEDLSKQREGQSKNILSVMSCPEISKDILQILAKFILAIKDGDVKRFADFCNLYNVSVK